MELTTIPIALHPFTVGDAERLLAGDVDPLDGWEGGYSFTDEPELLAEFVGTVRRNGDPAPFGPYLVRRSDGGVDDGSAIGGVNLFGPPDERGAVEFGFGLVPAVRGEGLSPHVVAETMRVAGPTSAKANASMPLPLGALAYWMPPPSTPRLPVSDSSISIARWIMSPCSHLQLA